MRPYEQFLKAKQFVIPPCGFDVPKDALSPMMKPFQADIASWAIRKGRSGVFPDTGLGKTLIQLTIADAICKQTGGNFLLLAPLAVGRQTLAEARKFKIDTPASVCSEQSEVKPGITITNYQKLHRFDTASFVGVGLDEASILKAQDGKTRTALIEAFRRTPYRYCFTATPSPNDIMEIGSYCEFLGIMSASEMLSTFFIHDGGDTSKWRLKKHAAKDFYRWMASWSVMLRKPSDLGYSNEGYDLPPLRIHEHVVKTGKVAAGYLFTTEARGLSEQREARNDTIQERAEVLASLANERDESWLAWCNLNEESKAAAKLVDDCEEITGSQPDEVKERHMIDFTAGGLRAIVTKPSLAGFGLNWQHCCKMGFLGLSHSYEQFYQAVRRCWRFGQTQPVDVHVVVSDRDGAVLESIHRKQRESEQLVGGMVEATSEISRDEIRSTVRETVEYKPEKALEVPSWLLQA